MIIFLTCPGVEPLFLEFFFNVNIIWFWSLSGNDKLNNKNTLNFSLYWETWNLFRWTFVMYKQLLIYNTLLGFHELVAPTV